MRDALLVLVICVGCSDSGGGGSNGTVADAATDGAKLIDARSIDGPVVMDAPWLGDAPPMVAGHKHYVLDRVYLPTNNSQALGFGLDLNSDTTVDNQLGMVIATLASMGFDAQLTMNRLIDQGDAIMLADLGADNLTATALATFTLYQGANPTPTPCTNSADTVCRKHLAGTGAFAINGSTPTTAPLVGSITAGQLTAGPNALTIQLALAQSPPIIVTLVGARVDLTSTATAMTGRLGGAILAGDIDGKLIPGMRAGFETAVKEDCTLTASPPGCGCPTTSQGAMLLNLFDVAPTRDCSISVAELKASTLIQALLAPDLMIGNQPALSVGIGVTGVAATFTAPM